MITRIALTAVFFLMACGTEDVADLDVSAPPDVLSIEDATDIEDGVLSEDGVTEEDNLSSQDTETSPDDDSTRPPAPASAVVSTKTSGAACEVARTLQVGVWGNGGNCDGEPAFVLTVELSHTCFGWERSLPDGTTRWNSATNFRCYQDRVCYTQHPASGTCDNPIGTTDKQWMAGTCSAGTMILSGSEDCPEAPAEGCPLSEKQQGSSELSCDTP